uniref:Myosin XVB n=1 Tax=Otus sunia TaxID=257818 RepID=A0A8C8AMH8_9STRI
MLQQQETYLSSPLQATDHTFLQKCHYHHGNSPWYTKPKLPLPVFTVKHYAGPVTYQVHKFLNKNRDQLRPEVLDIFSQSRLEVLEEDDQRFFLLFCRSHIFFIRCITPNPKKLSNIFDVEYVTCQLRHSGILQAIHIRKEGYPVHLPFQNFLARYSSVLAWDSPGLQLQPWFLSYQHLIFQVWPPGWEKAQWLGEERRLCSCAVSCGGEPLRSLSDWTILLFSHPSRKRYRRLKKTLVQFNTMILISRHLIQRRKHCQVTALFSGPGVLSDVSWLPFQLCNTRPLSLAGQYRAQANQITEALPPEVKVKDDLSLPPTINSYPFSSFIKSHFQKTDFPPPGQPLQHPLTHLEAEYQGSALEINKLVRDNLHGWQEVLLGNYIAGRGLNNVALRNEIFSQVVAQTWKNPDMEHSQRAWVLMATLLSCFAPSPALEKPLLKFVSDHGMEGYNAVCQRKILTAAQYTEVDSTFSRAYPPTQLEWTANQRRGKMVLDVHTFNEEKFSAEVESWMTGEQYAGWLLSARGCDKKSRGWSVSMFTGNTWQDLLGCDFVLDLIGEMEEASNFSSPSQSAEYPITPERDRSFLQYSDLDSAHRYCNSFLQAQQMTLQAMSISQQQQQRQQPLANSRPRVSSPPQAQVPAPVSIPVPATSPKPKKHPSSQNAAPPKAPEPPAKAEEPLSSPIAPASPLPPLEPKPKNQTPKVKKEPPVVKPSGPKTRPEPSREIRNIIKMYQSRPAPEPQPIEPVRRVSKPFLKKNDPKNEALAKLGMMNLPSPKSIPPPLKPKPGSASSSIKEKQLPLLSIFSPEGTPPSAPPPPPPLPSPLLPGSPGWQESTGKVAEDEGIKTQLYKLTTSVSFSYANPAWKIFLRKEVFYPKENFSHPYCLNLLCEQIMRDTFSDSCFRISREEKRKMKDLLMEFRVGNDVQSIQEDGIKKRIVLAARDNWANYFSRLFPVHGENGSDVQILGVSHRGVRLLKLVEAAGYNPEHLKILRSYSFADVLSVEMKGSDALEFSLKTEQLILHSPKAPRIKAMVELFIQELRQDTNYVVALRSYITDDKSLLSFKKGDLIELLPMQGVEPGWQFGSTGGRCGIFPTSLVQLAAAPDYLSTSMDRRGGVQKTHQGEPSISP